MSKIWFVTGASRGLGRAIVSAALESGDAVVATARQREAFTELADLYGKSVLPLALDVTDPEAVKQAIATAQSRFGRLDVVVNNAGYANMGAFEDITAADFHDQMDTNFFGTVNVTRATVPLLRRQGSGHIFQIASAGSRVAVPGLSPYQAAKFAVRGFSLVVAQELAPLGIRVTVVEPGGMRTDWAGSSMSVYEIGEHYRSTVGSIVTMLRSGSGQELSDPAKIARTIVSLAGREDAPVELLVGTDAVQYAQHAARVTAEEDEKWQMVATSVGF